MVLELLSARAITNLALFSKDVNDEGLGEILVELLGFRVEEKTIGEITKNLREISDKEEDYPLLRRWYKLLSLLNLPLIGEYALDFALTWLMLPDIPGQLEHSRNSLTLESVVEWCGGTLALPKDYHFYRGVAEKLRQILPWEEGSKEPFFRQTFSMDEDFLAYLCGEKVFPQLLKSCGSWYHHDPALYSILTVHEEIAQKVTTQLEHNRKGWLHLSGEDQSELKSMVENACNATWQDMIFIDIQKFLPLMTKNSKALWALQRILFLYETPLCLYGITNELVEDQEKMSGFHQILEALEEIHCGVVFCTESTVAMISRCNPVVRHIEVPTYTRSERISLWEHFSMLGDITGNINCEDLGSRYQLDCKQVEKAVELIRLGDDYHHKTVATACEAVLPPPRQGNIKKISTKYTLDQLKLPKSQKQAIENICDHVRFRHKVYDGWNMESKYAYGKNVSALFVGPPGTGKTMAVHVLSNMLDLPLYRIDLSQVVDKYIGETEKRLEEIFVTAEKSNVILFFDEADSIFGKRSEVNDAKDKYANTEVSYILQRMEQYDGIIILATNYKKNIDEAFMRRMRYLVEFTLPDKELRKEIWVSSFAPEVPLHKIDFEYLSIQFELSGGSIKNIALNATFLAAAKGKSVTMWDVLESVKNENIKMGKTMLLQDFGQYGMLMKE